MSMLDRSVDVIGEPVICQKWWNLGKTRKCVAGDVHRVDPDLELCVCKRCGQGWMRNVDAIQKLDESLRRLMKANASLTITLNNMKYSFQKLADSVEGAEKK